MKTISYQKYLILSMVFKLTAVIIFLSKIDRMYTIIIVAEEIVLYSAIILVFKLTDTISGDLYSRKEKGGYYDLIKSVFGILVFSGILITGIVFINYIKSYAVIPLLVSNYLLLTAISTFVANSVEDD